MAELLIIAVIVVIAAAYVWKKLSAEASGKKSCCEQSSSSGSCAFKDFIEQEGKPQRLECSAGDRKKTQAGRDAGH